MQKPKMRFGYWFVRGRGQVCRLLLAYTTEDWQQTIHRDPIKWFQQQKPNLGLAFPNLPYLFDGQTKITQFDAVCWHIIKRSDKKQLLGKDVNDNSMITSIWAIIKQIWFKFGSLVYNPQWEKNLQADFQSVKPKLDNLHKFIEQKEYVMGYITALDFFMAEVSHVFEKMYPQKYKQYPEWAKIRQKIENLPEIKAYYLKQNAIKQPFYWPAKAVIKF